jgi:lysyl-tRNA synthetase, class II
MSIKQPDYHAHEEFINRSRKLQEIRDVGIDPYPHKYEPTRLIGELQQSLKDKDIGHSDDAASGSTEGVKVAGRLVLFRAMGKNAFSQIQDESGRLQIMFNRDSTVVEGYDMEKEPTKLTSLKFIEKKIDLGDIIGIEGNLFRTQKGEITVFAKKVTLLCKTLLPLPDKHSGLTDKGVRYRKRWVDMISNTEVLETFFLRTKIIKSIRKYLDSNGFLEVETPILQNVYGGADAAPFITTLNALHQQMFMRISLEIPLKKLIVGGHLKVYELGKVFRNEGIDRTHNPEFTELEAYSAYWDYNDLMNFVESMYETVATEIFGTTKLTYKKEGEEEPVIIDVKAPWIRISMKDSIKKYGNKDVDSMTDEQMKQTLMSEAKVSPSELKNKPRGLLIAMMFEKFVESHLIQPHHITDHPIETTPLCKLHRNPEKKKQGLVERFESFVLGKEIINAYTELNDPEMQRSLLEKQSMQKADDKVAPPPLDEDFIEAICQGMPPTGGFGMGVDRMVMLFAGVHSIRDVLYFPLMKIED